MEIIKSLEEKRKKFFLACFLSCFPVLFTFLPSRRSSNLLHLHFIVCEMFGADVNEVLFYWWCQLNGGRLSHDSTHKSRESPFLLMIWGRLTQVGDKPQFKPSSVPFFLSHFSPFCSTKQNAHSLFLSHTIEATFVNCVRISKSVR